MTEELVTLETAKLLKAAGFKEDVSSFYELVYKGGSGPEYEIDESYDAQNYNTDVYSISAPTQSIAQKWLRENKNRKTHGGYGFIAPICRDILKKEIVDKISIEVNIKDK